MTAARHGRHPRRARALLVGGLALAGALTWAAFALAESPGETAPISVAQGGGVGTGSAPVLSDDGTIAAFVSADQLTPDDGDVAPSVYLRDRGAPATSLVSTRACSGTGCGEGESDEPSMDGTGTTVAFTSTATDLVLAPDSPQPGPSAPPVPRVYVADVTDPANPVIRLSGAAPEKQDAASRAPALSSDGATLAFVTDAPLDPQDLNDGDDIYLRDLASGALTLVAPRPCSSCNGSPDEPQLPGGRGVVVFSTTSSNDELAFTEGDGSALTDQNGGVADIVAWRGGSSVELVSRTEDGGQFSDGASHPAVAGDASAVAFQIGEANFDGGFSTVWARRLGSGATTTRVSRATDGTPATDPSLSPAISTNGRIVTFVSSVRGLTDDTCTVESLTGACPPDVFVHDLLTRATTLVSVTDDGANTDTPQEAAYADRTTAVDGSGRIVAFDFDDPALDGGPAADVAYVRDRTPVLETTPADSVDFGTSTGGPVERPVQLADRGTGPLIVSGITVEGPAAADYAVLDPDSCIGRPLYPDEPCSVVLRFTPGGDGARTATLRITSSDPGGDRLLLLQAQAARTVGLAGSPDPVEFGTNGVGTTSASRTATFTNTGSLPLVLGAARLEGLDPGDFRIGASSCDGALLGPGASCTVALTMVPTAAALRTATLVVPDATGAELGRVSLRGTGAAGRIGLEPDPIDFGTVEVGGQSDVRTAIATNLGPGVIVPGAPTFEGLDPGEFAIVSNACTAPLAPGDACGIDLVFRPTASSLRTATLALPSDATPNPVRISLRGNGQPGQLTLASDPTDFGDVPVGTTSTTRSVTATNPGGGAVTLGEVAFTGPQASEIDVVGGTCATGTVLGPGESCTYDLTLTPAAAGTRSATIVVPSNAAGSPTTAALTGNGVSTTQPTPPGQPAARIAPSPLDFGMILVGTTAGPLPVTITNTGTGPFLPIDRIDGRGGQPGDFAVDAGTCSGAVLAPGQACVLQVTFTPGALGARSGIFALGASGTTLGDVVVMGTGVAPRLSLSPSAVAFGDQPVGATSPARTVTLTNSGTAPAVIGSVGIDGAGFVIVSDGCAGRTLQPGQSCTIRVTVTPAGRGGASATLIVTGGGGARVGLSVTGTQGTLAVSPDPVEFGDQVTGTPPVTRSITVRNTGDGPLPAITSATIGGTSSGGGQPGDFAVTQNGCQGVVLQPGDTCTVTISFTAGAGGLRTAVLNVAAGTGIQTTLRGTGFDPVITATPEVAPLGFPVRIAGTGFPPSVELVIAWNPGLGSTLVTTTPEGTFETSLLLFHKDLTGPRLAEAQGDGYVRTDDLLAVPGTYQPPDFANRG